VRICRVKLTKTAQQAPLTDTEMFEGAWYFGFTGFWLLVNGCRSVQTTARGRSTLKRSSLKSGWVSMKKTHCSGPGGPMMK